MKIVDKIKYKIRRLSEYPLVTVYDQKASKPPKQRISPIVYQTWVDNKFGKTHARSLLNFRNINKNIDDKIDNENNNMQFNNEEIEIFKKISEWPKCVEISTKKLEPHRIPVYLYELSSQFHSYWNMGKDNESMRFLDKSKKLNKNKAVLLNSVLKTIGTGMKILDVETPETM